MDTFAFVIVLFAGLLHATWNSIVKSQTAQLPVIALIASSATVGSVFAIPFVPVPSPAALLPITGVFAVSLGAAFLQFMIIRRLRDKQAEQAK